MLPLTSLVRLAVLSTATALLGGCVIAGDVRPYPAMAPVQTVMPPQATPSAGAIYASGPGLQLYGDRRARDVGDLLTITLQEATTASTTANTKTNKETNLSLGTPTLFGAPVTLADARSAPALAYFDAARRLAGETVPITIPGEKRGLLDKIFARRAA